MGKKISPLRHLFRKLQKLLVKIKIILIVITHVYQYTKCNKETML